jgi:electron transport complex protein RnfG
MREIFKITGVLTSVCIICAFFLSLVFGVAKGKIEANRKKAIEDGIFQLVSDAQAIKEVKLKNSMLYRILGKESKLIGYAFLAEGQGYQGEIKILGVIDPSLKRLKGIEVIESVETPGLGGRIQEESFKKQWKGLSVTPIIEYVKNEVNKDNQIKAITGATISSRAVVNILNKKIKELKNANLP